MFLGIPYNKWHFILAVFAVGLVFFLLWTFLAPLLLPQFNKTLLFFVLLFFSIQIAHHLQSANEIYQALSRNVEDKYGSFKGFQKNSRDDFRWFWRGIAVSWIIPFIVFLV